MEIVDLTVYYGQNANFSDADRVDVIQFKYSPKRASKPFQAGDAKKTIAKFAESYRDHQRTHGVQAVTEKTGSATRLAGCLRKARYWSVVMETPLMTAYAWDGSRYWSWEYIPQRPLSHLIEIGNNRVK